MRLLAPFDRLTARQLDEVIAIYETYFAVPWEWVAGQLYDIAHKPGGPFYGFAALDGETVTGLVVARYLSGGRIWYIPYLAIHPDLRGNGWGSWVLGEVLPAGEAAARAHGDPGCAGALVEVESVEGAATPVDTEVRIRRQAFYRRQGGLATGARAPRFPWAPAEMPSFELMFIPMSAWDGQIDNRLRYTLIRSLMVEAYDVPEDAPWLLAALERFSDL